MKPCFFIVESMQLKVPAPLLAKIGGEVHRQIKQPNNVNRLFVKSLLNPNEKEWKVAGWKVVGVL